MHTQHAWPSAEIQSPIQPRPACSLLAGHFCSMSLAHTVKQQVRTSSTWPWCIQVKLVMLVHDCPIPAAVVLQARTRMSVTVTTPTLNHHTWLRLLLFTFWLDRQRTELRCHSHNLYFPWLYKSHIKYLLNRPGQSCQQPVPHLHSSNTHTPTYPQVLAWQWITTLPLLHPLPYYQLLQGIQVVGSWRVLTKTKYIHYRLKYSSMTGHHTW